MKKRFVTTLISLLACIACLIGLVACGEGNADPVAGKTYTFEKLEITKGVSGAEKEIAEASMNEMFKDDYIAFGKDGEFTITMMGTPMTGTYTQSGATVTAKLANEDQTMKVSGDTVTMSETQNGIGIKMTYKLVKEESGEITSPTLNVAGKKFIMTECLVNGSSVMDLQDAEISITFNQDGTCVMKAGTGEDLISTYTETDTTVTIAVPAGSPDNAQPVVLTKSGNELTSRIEQDGMTQISIFSYKDDDNQDGDNKGDTPANALAGKTYALTDYLMDGKSILDAADESFKSFNIVFRQNNEYTITLATTSEGTYTLNSNTVTLIPNVQGGSPVTLTISENTLTWLVDEDENMVIVFTAQN